MVARKRRQYTAKEQAAVLADVVELGVCGAARKHGIAQSSELKREALEEMVLPCRTAICAVGRVA